MRNFAGRYNSAVKRRAAPSLPRSDSRRVAAFRLARHHLDQRAPQPVERICGDVCGIQAQVMSAAYLALWTRNPRLRREAITNALWTERSLVKTSCMRQTLHLIPAADFTLYITALKRSRTAAVSRFLSRIKISAVEARAMQQVVIDALEEGPLTQQALVAKAKAGASRRVQHWLRFASSAFRPSIVEGLICYGPSRGAEVTLARTDRWLGPQPEIDEEDAKRELLRRFLRAYGPATLAYFVKWSGIGVVEATPAWESIGGDVQEIAVDGASAWILRRDARALAEAEPNDRLVRLLPAFDSYLLAHAVKDHLLEARFYKRVYRNQGWL